MSNSIFISYRRDGAEAMAQLLNDRLVKKGYQVFYDIKSLPAANIPTREVGKTEPLSYGKRTWADGTVEEGLWRDGKLS